jgi:hypothetical protein
MDFCLPKEKTVLSIELPIAFKWVKKMDLEVKTSIP